MGTQGVALTAALADVFAAAGCRGALCLQALDGPGSVSLDADEPVVAASVIKVLIAVEVERQLAAGVLDAGERMRLPAADRTPGPVGFSLYAHDVEVSLGDLLVPMLTISDNVATDALLARVGVAACNETARELGLIDTVLVGDLRSAVDSIGAAAGFADWRELTAWLAEGHPAADVAAVESRVAAAPALDPARATRTTPRDMCHLLRRIWHDDAAPPAGCRRIRELMAAQLTRDRLASGFPAPARVAAKSGGLAGIVVNEIGVIEWPGGRRCAVAVFTRPTGGARPAIHAAIGRAAALAAADLWTS